jgi:hypothetical protein
MNSTAVITLRYEGKGMEVLGGAIGATLLAFGQLL